MASVVVEVDDFAVAARSAFRSGGDPLGHDSFLPDVVVHKIN